VRPAAKSLAKPAYPEQCRRRGQEGKVVLRVLVGTDGSVGKVEIVTPSAVKAFDRAAVEGAKRWRFEPARRGDTPVEAWMKIPVIFRLED
jgi:protein TonB